jgi:mannopine transport system permease protein
LEGRVLPLAAWMIVAFLVIPTVVVIPMSFGSSEFLEFPPRDLSLRWYARYVSDEDWIGPTIFSLKVALLTTIAAVAVGVPASLALVRGRLPGRSMVSALVTMPLVVPIIITALGTYFFLARLRLVGSVTGFVIAHTVLAVPYVVLITTAVLRGFDERLETAALSLGASRAKAFLRVTLPITLPGILTAAVFAFLTSFDEATVSLFISGVGGKTLPMKLFEGITDALTPVVAVVSTLLILLSVVLLGSIELARARAARASGERAILAPTGRGEQRHGRRILYKVEDVL